MSVIRSIGRRVAKAREVFFPGGAITVAAGFLVAAQAAVYLVQLLSPAASAWMMERLALGLGPFAPWQLFTYLLVFDPAAPLPFLVTLAVCLMVAGDVSVVLGARRFFLYYCCCGLAAGLASALWVFHLGPRAAPGVGMGAIGAVLGLVLAFGRYFGTRRLYGFLPARPWCVALGLLLLGLPAVLVSMKLGRPAAMALLVQAGGLAGAAIWFALEPRYRHWRLVRQIQEEAMLEASVDRLLAKVKETGSASLTPAELRALKRASRVMRSRRRESS